MASRAWERLVGGRERRRPAGAPAESSDELQELAATFRWTVSRLESLMQEVEQAHQKALQAEVEKKKFYREVIRAVTHGKFELVDREEIPLLGTLVDEVAIGQGENYALCRHLIRELGLRAGMAEERVEDLVLAAGEAITNAYKHAMGGYFRIYRSEGSLVVRVADRGPGIGAADLPAAILQPGYSTQVSLGMGYTLMLKLSDRLWLGTGSDGTTVQIEKWVHQPPPEEEFPLGVLTRF